jgi:hypothetical protein
MLNNSKVMITPQQEMKDAIQQFECAENLFNTRINIIIHTQTPVPWLYMIHCFEKTSVLLPS